MGRKARSQTGIEPSRMQSGGNSPDRLNQCWTREPLACPHEARAKQLAPVMYFRDSRQKPQLHTASDRGNAANTNMSVFGLLLPYRPVITEGLNPSLQCCSWQVKSPYPPNPKRVHVQEDARPVACHSLPMITRPGSHPAEGRWEQKPRRATICGSTVGKD